LHYIWLDWRHLGELLAAGHDMYDDLDSRGARPPEGPGWYRREHHGGDIVLRRDTRAEHPKDDTERP